MSVFVGNYKPIFNVRLNKSYISPYIIVSGVTDITTGQLLDSNKVVTSYTLPTTGTQYLIQQVQEKYIQGGTESSLILSVDNTGIATVDQAGDTHFNTTGNLFVIGSYGDGRSPIKIPISNISGSGGGLTTTQYIPDTIDPSKHILVVYNSGTTPSTDLKTYYTGHRPQFSTVNVLNINCDSGEMISYNNFVTGIRLPIINWITGNSGVKPIKYIVLLSDIPTRISNNNFYSVSYALSIGLQQMGFRDGKEYQWQSSKYSCAEFQRTTALVSHINFNTHADNIGYIDRISENQTGLYLTGNRNNTGYYFEDYGAPFEVTFVSGRHLYSLLNAFPAAPYVYRSKTDSPIITGNNIAGFISWGANGGRGGSYANDGSIKWGTGNWYIMTTIESYNGQRSVWQGNYIDWFSSGAFGGTGWENCPVGAVGTTEEPLVNGTEYYYYFTFWNSGLSFIDCAWANRSVPYFIALGDPLVFK